MEDHAPRFYYDFASPYAYLAAERIDELIPDAVWTPIAFGPLLRQIARVPWSMQEGRETGMREVEERARRRGLPAVRWPAGWPIDNYSLGPLRVAALAEQRGLLKRFSLTAYRAVFGEGASLSDLRQLLDVAEAAGLERDAAATAVERQQFKDLVRARTEDAIARGVTGIPTVAVGDRLFWGDDRLEDAAAAARSTA